MAATKEFTERYVLFIHPTDDNSMRTLELLDASSLKSDTRVTNVSKVPAQFLPPKVIGVPTMCDTNDNTWYKGTECMNKLRQHAVAKSSVEHGLHKLSPSEKRESERHSKLDEQMSQCKTVEDLQKLREAALPVPKQEGTPLPPPQKV